MCSFLEQLHVPYEIRTLNTACLNYAILYHDALYRKYFWAPNLKLFAKVKRGNSSTLTTVKNKSRNNDRGYIHYAENGTKFDRSGKGKENHLQSVIEVYSDVEDSNIQAKLASKEGCSPHLKVFKRNSSTTGIYIVGDSRHIRCPGSSVTSAVLQLIALYYVFDIDYPKCYAMVQLAQYYNEFCRKAAQERMSRKRPRVSEYSSDSSEEWTGEWSSDKCVKIHKNTSEWTDVTLRKLHLSWDRQTITKTPNQLLDFLKIPPLTQEMENISNYIEKNIDFDMSSDNSNVKHSVRYRIFSNLQRRLRNSAHSDGESERCDQSMLEHARIYGIEFLATLKKLVRREAYAQPRYKALYLRILESFCKLCGLFGSRELVRRSCKILEQDVISVPDLVFEADDSPYILGRHLRDSSGASTLCISEVKSAHYVHSKVHKRQKVTRSSTDSADVSQHLSTEVFQPLEVRGSSQHVGQLLLESPHSLFVFSRSSIGMMFTKTKVLMTCLKLSESYLENMDTRLLETDRGVIYVTDTFDILKADDRNEVLNALLRLGCCEDRLRQDHEGEESTSEENS